MFYKGVSELPNIQGQINQLLGTGAILTGLYKASPDYQQRQELKKARMGESLLNQQRDVLRNKMQQTQVSPDITADELQKTILPDLDIADDISSNLERNLQRQFELDPNEQTLTKLRDIKQASLGRQQKRSDIMFMLEQMRNVTPEQAMQHMQQVGNQQVQQRTNRRNFMSYLRNEPSSLGGKVGQLPPDLQKQIANQYTKSQRKALMDRIDREEK